MSTNVTDFVELGTFARRAPQDEETEESASHHVKVDLTSYDTLFLSISATTLEFDATDVKHYVSSELRKSTAAKSISESLSEFRICQPKLQISLNLGTLPEGLPRMKKGRRVLRTM